MKRSFTGWPVFEVMIVAVMAGQVMFSNLAIIMSAIRWCAAAAESLITDACHQC
jgi:hypothetical protein